jgi:dihydrofolate reductase
MITIIVAYDENRVIGNKGKIPWKISEDMKFFKKTTVGSSCVMGRKTWDSLPDGYKPLPDRENVVVSSNAVMLENEWLTKGCKNVDFEDNLKDAISFTDKEIFIIGGEQIYKQALDQNLAHRVLASEIKGTHEGDAFFPELQAKFREVIQEFDDFIVVEYIL